MKNENKVKVVILAAGKGTRMMSETPKVLMEVNGKPMVKHVIDSVMKSGVTDRPVVVVGYKKEDVMSELGDTCDFVVQEEQLGTGHAVMIAQKSIGNTDGQILVLYGDNPFVSPETIKNLATKNLESDSKITMGVVKLPDFKDWREFFYSNFSRVVRDNDGNILKSVEFR